MNDMHNDHRILLFIMFLYNMSDLDLYVMTLCDCRKDSLLIFGAYVSGILTVLEILGHFLFQGSRGRWDHPVWSRYMYIYHQMFLDSRNKNMYGLGVGILIVFEIFSQFPIWRVG